MKKISFLLSFLFFLSFNINLNAEEKSEENNEEFNISEMIMEHIGDAHEWHILEYKNSEGENVGISLPLPIILIHNGQFDVFLSSKFEHGHKDVVKGKNTYRIEHDKIYAVGENGELIKPLDFSITKNVFSMLLVSIIILWVFISVANSYKKRPGRPKGLQSFIEPVILFVKDDILRPSLEEKTDKFAPFLLTLFFFLLFNNMMGIIPFFPGNANVTGNIAVTMTLALFTFIMINVNGSKDYWKHTFWMPGVPVFVKPVLAIVELIGMIVKPVALTIRLFANITAGHIIILSLVGLIFLFKSIWVSPASILMVTFMSCLELLVAFLQAYIFTLLSALFIGMAIKTEEHHH